MKETNNNFCFISTDKSLKQISFDIISTLNPLENHFKDK